MTRDEILAEIEQLSKLPAESGIDLADDMRKVDRLATQYIEADQGWDERYLLEAVLSALGNFANKAQTL